MLIDKQCHFPDPDVSIVVLIIKDWVAQRIQELTDGPQTPANQKSLQKFHGADPTKMLMEPPVIMDDNKMKVCMLSRKVGTLWIDQIVNKLKWDRFLTQIDPTGAFNTLDTTTPGVATKDDLLRLAEASTHTADVAKIYITDLEGTTEKGLVFEAKDSVITPDIFTKDFLKGYRFDELKVTIASQGDADYPKIDGTLLEMAIGTLTVTEDLLQEGEVTYRIFSLPTIKGLIHENDTTIYDGKYTHNGFIKY